MIEIASLFHRVLDHFLGARRLWQLADGHHFGTALHQFLDFQANLAQVYVEIFENVSGHAATFFDQA